VKKTKGRLARSFSNSIGSIADLLPSIPIGDGVYRTLSLGRAHPLPEIVLLYTHDVRSEYGVSSTSASVLACRNPTSWPNLVIHQV
jgi:hypothetical protein